MLWNNAIDFLLLLCILDEPGPKGKTHLHTRRGIRTNRPPRGHPSKRNAYIWRGTPQYRMMHEAKWVAQSFMGLPSPQLCSATTTHLAEVSHYPYFSHFCNLFKFSISACPLLLFCQNGCSEVSHTLQFCFFVSLVKAANFCLISEEFQGARLVIWRALSLCNRK